MRERRVLWVVLAAFVVGMVAVAGLAAVGDGSSGSGPPRLPQLAFGASAGAGRATAPAGSDSMPATGPVEYRVAPGVLGAPLPDDAPAWTVDDRAGVDGVRRLAVVLGIEAAPVADDAGWTVSDADRQLRVERSAGAPWSYGPVAPGCGPDTTVSSDGVTSTRSCAFSGSGTAFSGSATATVVAPPVTTVEPCPVPECPPGTACAQVCPAPEPEPVPAPPPEPQRPADLPSRADAERIGRAFLEKAGADLAGADVRVDDGFSQWLVSADPRAGGMPTQGMTATVAVGPKGEVQFASGWLADPKEGDDYPLAGVDAGIERLKSGYPGGGWSPYPGAERAIAPDGPACAGCALQVRTITGVRLGLLFSPVFTGDGQLSEGLLVPSYLFRFDDTDYEQPVIAVADEFLPKPPEVKPVPEPAPMPVEPGPGTQTGAPGFSPDADAAQGVAYPMSLYTHCGVRDLRFDARNWVADPPLDDGSGNPPPGWGNPAEPGAVMLVSEGEAVFVSEDGTKKVRFVPRAADAPAPQSCM